MMMKNNVKRKTFLFLHALQSKRVNCWGWGGVFLYQSRQLLFIWLSLFYLKTKTIPRNTNKQKSKKKKQKKSRGVSDEDIFQYNGQTIKHESNLALIVYTTPSSRLCKKRKKKMKEK